MSDMESFFSSYLRQSEKFGFDLKKLEEIYNQGILKGYEAGMSDDNVEYYAEGYLEGYIEGYSEGIKETKSLSYE